MNIGPGFGAHIQDWDDSVEEWCETSHCSCITVVATRDRIPTLVRWMNEGWLKALLLRSDPGDVAFDFGGNVAAQAIVTANRNLEFARPFVEAGLGPILWILGNNEQAVWDAAQMLKYAEHEAIRAEVIAAHDWGIVWAGRLRTLVMKCPVGHPDLSLWPFAVPFLRRVQTVGGGLALDQYSQPRIDSAGEWTSWRHIKVYEQFPDDLQDLPLFVVEWGIDGGVTYDGCPTPRPKIGWRGYTDEAGFLEQIKGAAPYMVKARGICLFTFRGPGWPTFEMAGTLAIARWIREQGGNDMTKQELWDQLTAPYDTYPALAKPIIARGGQCVGTETIINGVAYQFGIIPSAGDNPTKVISWATVGDWGNVRLALQATDLPL